MSRPYAAPRYTGARVMPFRHPISVPARITMAPDSAAVAANPAGSAAAAAANAARSSKELEFTGAAASVKADTTAARNANVDTSGLHVLGFSSLNMDASATAAAARTIPSAFIGGGCCVHISVEYAPIVPTAKSAVLVAVADSEGTVLAWEKIEQPGAHYTVKENIITTNPGATVKLFAVNATARIRWCEVFSC